MATHRITLTTIGAGISSTLDLQRWNGTAWVTHITNIPRASFLAENGGYEFEDTTGAVQFKLVDDGVCGTEKIFYCVEIPTTTAEATTTSAGTTTVVPTTTTEPTTTAEPTYYTWYVTSGTLGTCGDNVGSSAVYSNTNIGADITAFYTDNTLLTLYNAGGVGLIAWSNMSGGLAQFRGSLDTPTSISYIATC